MAPCLGRASDPQSPGQDGPSSLLPLALGAVVAELSPVPGQGLMEPWLGFPRQLLWFGVGAPGTLAGTCRGIWCSKSDVLVGQAKPHLWRYHASLWRAQ